MHLQDDGFTLGAMPRFTLIWLPARVYPIYLVKLMASIIEGPMHDGSGSLILQIYHRASVK